MSKKGAIIVQKEDELLRVIKKILPKRAVMIVGEAGK